jgi:hypothetical protein
MTPNEMAARIEVLEWRLERLTDAMVALLETLRDGDATQEAAKQIRTVLQRNLAMDADD